MLMNNLDPDVAEKPDELIVYGGTGKAARNWECYERIVSTLRRLKDDETLLVQSGKPVGVFRTHTEAPRVLIANSNLVPRWGNWKEFLQSVFKSDAKGDFGAVKYQRQGSEKVLNIVCTPLKDARGREVIGGAVIIEDVTDRVDAEHQLAQTERLAAVGKVALNP